MSKIIYRCMEPCKQQCQFITTAEPGKGWTLVVCPFLGPDEDAPYQVAYEKVKSRGGN